MGVQIGAGPGTFGLAVSRKGTVATTDIGYERVGITLIDQSQRKAGRCATSGRALHIATRRKQADPDWKGVFFGIAFDSERAVWVSEGDSGRLRLVDIGNGNHQKIVSLNQGEWKNSFTADLAFDAARRLIFVVDQANFRVAMVDAKKGAVFRRSVSAGCRLRLRSRPTATPPM